MAFCLLRPSGKFLVATHQRYLLGYEAMILQGIPIHHLDISMCSDSVTQLHITCTGLSNSSAGYSNCDNKVLHSMGGNSMHMRCIMASICAALMATDPMKLKAAVDPI